MKINELHDKLYDLLKVFDEICRRNEITYWMHGGSSIGAVREHDFIPWDDDMDVLIRGEDFKKFRETMKKELPEHIHYVEPEDFSPYFYDYTIRLIDERWTLRPETEEDTAYKNYQNRVGIDVFLMSHWPDNGLEQKIWFLKYDLLYGMAMNYRFKTNYEKYDLFQKCEVAVLKTMGRIYSGKSPDKIIREWKNFIESADNIESDTRMITNTVPHCYWHPMPAGWFCDTVYTDFRDRKVPVQKEFDKILTVTFGDYMTPVRDTEKYITHLQPDVFEGVDIPNNEGAKK